MIAGDDIDTGADGVCNTTGNNQNIVPVNVPTEASVQSYLNSKTWGQSSQCSLHGDQN